MSVVNRKILVIVLAIVAIIVVSFAVWAILPYFINTTIDEPLPTATTNTKPELHHIFIYGAKEYDEFSMI